MAAFEERGGKLFINGREVLKGWESFTGWYWFAVEKVQEQTSIINGKPIKDTIWYGLVQGFEEEWGDFSQAELESFKPMVREKGGEPMNEILELAYLLCKRTKERGMDDDKTRWVVDQALERFDTFEFLTRVSVNQIDTEVEG